MSWGVKVRGPPVLAVRPAAIAVSSMRRFM
jgi:hypothetical protein